MTAKAGETGDSDGQQPQDVVMTRPAEPQVAGVPPLGGDRASDR